MRAVADELILPRGFFRRGSVYYRYYGDCMLQCIGFGYDDTLMRKTLSFAMLPLGADYPESAFTPRGCPFQYSLSSVNREAAVSAALPEDELASLEASIFPVLDAADSAEKLFSGLCELDCKKHGRPDMLDPLKLYACLQAGMLDKAKEIAESVMEDHHEALRRYSQSTADSDARQKKRIESETAKAQPSKKVLNALRYGDKGVQLLLGENLANNKRYIRKHLHIEI